jgi:hypothetical protein
MDSEGKQQNEEECSVAQLLQDINAGITDPKLIDIPTRQLCVDALKKDGITVSQMAHLLKCTERSIYRDLKLLRKKNKLAPSKELVEESIGELRQEAMTHHSYLMRLARSKDATMVEKIHAEFAAWKVLKEYVEKMQTLGYLPLKPQEVSGDFYHHINAEEGGESIEEVKKMLIEIESVAHDTDTYTPKLAEDIKKLSGRLEKAEIVTEASKLAEQQQETITNKENENDEQIT